MGVRTQNTDSDYGIVPFQRTQQGYKANAATEVAVVGGDRARWRDGIYDESRLASGALRRTRPHSEIMPQESTLPEVRRST